MITLVNKSNAAQYSALFSEATQALIQAEIDNPDSIGIDYEKDSQGNPVIGENGYQSSDEIQTLEQYFYYLNKLISLGGTDGTGSYEDLHSAGRRYTILPLDEDAFVIDANKRSITIPSGFSGGVAVKGDKFAEVLYFEVDRFFDSVDLDDTNIFIQWVNANGEKGVSTPIVMDKESKANKLIFGWALSDAITEESGNVQFAVRFYKWIKNATQDVNDHFSFSLATQTATIKVNTSLDFQISDEDLEVLSDNDTLINRIVNSETRLAFNEDAAEPGFLLYIYDASNGVVEYKNLDEKVYFIDLDEEKELEDGSTRMQHKLTVQAGADDTGTLTYDWTYISPEGESHTNAFITSDEAEYGDEYILTTDESPVDTKIYYEKSNNRYIIYNTSKLTDEMTPVSEGLYEKVSSLTALKVGNYSVKVTNVKSKKNSVYTISDEVIVPYPSEAVINAEAWISNAIVDSEVEGANTTLTVVATNEEANGTNEGVLSYQWHVKEALADEFVTLADATSSSLILPEDDAALIEGEYYVTVTNSKNGVSVSTDSDISRVTYKVKAPKLVTYYDGSEVIATPNSEGINTIAITLLSVGDTSVAVGFDTENYIIGKDYDSVRYQWYYAGADSVSKDDDEEITGVTTNTYTPLVARQAYCKLTFVKNIDSNEYNDVVYSPIFVISNI